MYSEVAHYTGAYAMQDPNYPWGRLAERLREKDVPRRAYDIFGGFKTFVLRGNVIDLAVGVIIGASFNSVVTTLVRGLITPFLSVIGSQPDFSTLTFSFRGSTFHYGEFLSALISFLIQATVIYFLIVLPVNTITTREKRSPTRSDQTTKKCPECLSEIPIKARRCAFCGQEQPENPQNEGKK